MEAVEPLGRHAVHALRVDDQDRGEGRRFEVGQGDLAHLAAGLPPQRLDRRVAGLAHLRGDVFGNGVADDANSQPGRVACGELLAAEHRAQQPAVGCIGAERAGDDQVRDRRHMVTLHGRAGEGRLEAGQAAVGGGKANRAQAVGADSARDETGGDRSGWPTGRTAWAALGVPGIAGGAVEGGVAGAAGAELVHVADADDDGTGIAQGAVGAGLPWRGGRHQLGGAEALRAPRQRPLVLDHNGHTAQGPRGCAGQHLARTLGEGLDHGVERRVALLDPSKGGVEQIARVDLAGGDRGRLRA